MSTNYMNVPIGICLVQRYNRDEDQSARLYRYNFSVLAFTYVAYTCYHLTRKPISVVKTLLHRNCSLVVVFQRTRSITDATNEDTWYDYALFDGPDASALLDILDTPFLLTYGIAMFGSGFVAERVSLRYFFTFGMLFSAIFTYMFGIAKTCDIHSLWYFIAVQALASMLKTPGWPGIVTVVERWFGKAQDESDRDVAENPNALGEEKLNEEMNLSLTSPSSEIIAVNNLRGQTDLPKLPHIPFDKLVELVNSESHRIRKYEINTHLMGLRGGAKGNENKSKPAAKINESGSSTSSTSSGNILPQHFDVTVHIHGSETHEMNNMQHAIKEQADQMGILQQSMEEKADQMQQSMEETADQMGILQQSIKEKADQSQIDILNQRISTLEDEVTGLNKEKSKLSHSISTLKNEVTGLSKKKSKLSHSIWYSCATFILTIIMLCFLIKYVNSIENFISFLFDIENVEKSNNFAIILTIYSCVCSAVQVIITHAIYRFTPS